jgi:DNA-binding response OmpR family regulator
LILLDLMMPVMDGWTFRERQRQLAGAGAIPVLVLSGAREVRKAAEQLNAIAAIAKPFDLDDLLETIHALLTRINTAPYRGPT